MPKSKQDFNDILNAISASDSEYDGLSDEDGENGEAYQAINTECNDDASDENDFDSSDDEPLINFARKVRKKR